MKPKRSPSKKAVKDVRLEKIGARIRELRIAKGDTNYEHFAFKNDFSRSQVAAVTPSSRS